MKTGYIIKCTQVKHYDYVNKCYLDKFETYDYIVTEQVFTNKEDAFNQMVLMAKNKCKPHHCYKMDEFYSDYRFGVMNYLTRSQYQYYLMSVKVV